MTRLRLLELTNTAQSNTKQLNEKSKELELAKQDLVEKWMNVVGDDHYEKQNPSEATLAKYTKNLQKMDANLQPVEDAIERIGVALMVRRPTVNLSLNAPSTRGPQFKLVGDLKPFTLSSSNSPLEMRSWVERFREYGRACIRTKASS